MRSIETIAPDQWHLIHLHDSAPVIDEQRVLDYPKASRSLAARMLSEVLPMSEARVEYERGLYGS